MWGIAAIVSFALALVIWLAASSVHAGHVLNWVTFTITGLLCLAVHAVAPGWPRRGSA